MFNALLLGILHDLPKLDLSIADWTIQTQGFIKRKLSLKNEVNFELKDRKSKYFNKAILLEPVEKHFKKSYSESKIPITTVHQVKGKSLNAILIFFDVRKHKDTITFKDIKNDNGKVYFPGIDDPHAPILNYGWLANNSCIGDDDGTRFCVYIDLESNGWFVASETGTRELPQDSEPSNGCACY